MSFVIDATNTAINIDRPPQRIVSLVPSTTHSVCSFGLSTLLVGLTHFCTDPRSVFLSVPKIGGTKNIDIEKIVQLKPDIVLANQEENRKEDIFALREKGICVYVAFPKTIDEACSELCVLGEILHTKQQAISITEQIQHRRRSRKIFRYAYLIWNKPLMSISSDCFIASMLREIGGENVFHEQEKRYPIIEDIPTDTDALLLSSEPFPFQEKHRKKIAKRFAFPQSKIFLIDGSYCSWHGAKMVDALSYLHQWRDQL